jgi:hypothetical protein
MVMAKERVCVCGISTQKAWDSTTNTKTLTVTNPRHKTLIQSGWNCTRNSTVVESVDDRSTRTRLSLQSLSMLMEVLKKPMQQQDPTSMRIHHRPPRGDLHLRLLLRRHRTTGIYRDLWLRSWRVFPWEHLPCMEHPLLLLRPLS